MKRFSFILLFILTVNISLFADTPLLEKLQQITAITDIKEIKHPVFKEAYEFFYTQPIDHENPEQGTFKQYVLIGHRTFDAPVVVNLEGYYARGLQEGELSNLFKTNEVVIEHRFFNRSIPESGIPWDYLTLKQAATDQHKIIQTLRREVYPEKKWISTGISKGGQTTIYHRYFYPEDVEISVPYVAPFNLEYIDPRLEKYLSKLGATPEQRKFLTGNSQLISLSISDFQRRCFENLDELRPRFTDYIESRGYTFDMVGGPERALKLVIMEYPFAFWQWGSQPGEIPDKEVDDWDSIFEYLIKISSPDFFNDKDILNIHAFYYAALTETGMYAYNIKPYKKYFKGEPENYIDFRFALPKGYEDVPFNSQQLQKINHWLQTEAENMLFIYGGIDPWSATAVDLKHNNKCKKYIKADMHHGCRIKDFEHISRNDIIETLNYWLTGVKAEEPKVLFY